MMARRSAMNNKRADDGRGATSNSSDSRSDGLVIIYNVMANRSVPIVFILVSSLIIANISCDQVGSANEELDLMPVAASDGSDSAANNGGGSNNSAPTKYDPLNMLREIYLDHNSKVITLLSSPSSSSVQKFHPNGRYGRRSVDNNLAEAPGAHMELAKLRLGGAAGEDELDGDTMPLSHPSGGWLNSDVNNQADLDATDKRQQNQLRWLLTSSNKSNPQSRSSHRANADKKSFESAGSAADMSASFRQELNKLLKCNYSGVSNLFWCNS